MIRIALLSALLPALCAAANLDALRAAMAEIRARPADQSAPRGATAKLTIAKHQLRDWIESNLRTLPLSGDETEFARKLNATLTQAGLICDEAAGQKCPDEILTGSLEPVRTERKAFLTVITGLGIECGFDESAYVYNWSKKGWHRVWQNEQDDYTKDKYKPQTIQRVIIDGDYRANDYLALTLGTEPWCASSWHDVYYRVFRLGAVFDAGPLVEGSQWAFLGNDPPIQGSLSSDNGAMVAYETFGIGGDLREVVRHYKIDGSTVTRVDPVALKPRNFVDEWLTQPWNEALQWSEAPNLDSLSAWHQKLHKDLIAGMFLRSTMHCATMPDLWQVGVDFSNPPTPFGQPPNGTYFLVRWRPPYTFRMVDISKDPSPACTQPDRNADDAPPMLFFGWK